MSETQDPGIVQTTELIDALKILATFAGKVAKDKKISTSDFQYVVEIALNFDAIIKGFDGADEIVKELKSLKKDEVISIVAQLYAVADAFNAAKKG